MKYLKMMIAFPFALLCVAVLDTLAFPIRIIYDTFVVIGLVDEPRRR